LRHEQGERLVLALLVEWRLDCLVSLVRAQVVVVFLDGQRLDYQVNLVDGRVV
jgi:hypothetical protein